ncbi:MAG: hypothetical protein FD147_433 [Chloroflexi bacterium]|nr:MAG: hypothetical protein FD147_433 [Chloroflexota bacterium]
MNKRIWNIFLIIFLPVLISSCSSNRTSLLKESSCLPPCWFDITPGVTKFDDAVDLLIKIPGIKSDAEKLKSKLEYNKILDLSNVRENGLQISVSNEYVSRISIFTSGWMYSEIKNLYGEPEYYLSYYQQFESIHRFVFIIYPKSGLIISLEANEFNPETNNSIISFDSKVTSVTFISSEHFFEHLDSNLVGYQNNFITKKLEPWQGLGELETTKYEILTN